MTTPSLWELCVAHRGAETTSFLTSFFAEKGRRVLFFAGAGFDPRSTLVCELLSSVARDRTHAVFIKEERPNPSEVLIERAEANLASMNQAIMGAQLVKLDVFAADGAVVGGRTLISQIRQLAIEQYTDIVVDLSALSLGIGYPLVRFCFERLRRNGAASNLHVIVADEPRVDSAIFPIASDRVGTVHGFQGGLGLDRNSRGVKLWLPQLVEHKGAILERIRSYVQPHEVCPILPFPAVNPRLSDVLIEHYTTELESTWEVDSRNLVYADQRNPLDLYRTILRIDNARKRVFAEIGGSLVILTPLGSKALAVGALMAAMERDFPVVYVEAISYELRVEEVRLCDGSERELVHVWLAGEGYPWSIRTGPTQ